MIYVVGLDSDKTAIHFLAHARRDRVDAKFINLRDIADGGAWHITIPDDGGSWLRTSDSLFTIDPTASYYCRIIDLSSVQQDAKQVFRWRGLVSALSNWLEHIPGVVINRPGTQSDNFCKPLHEATLGALGFRVPASITSSDAVTLYRFASASPTVVKPVSGVLSNTRLVSPDEFLQFDARQGPVHLQRYIAGSDVRAHVVGAEVYAESIRSSGVDYRQRGNSAHCSRCDLPPELHGKIIEATKLFRLKFVGWDFKVDQEGRYWCLEANPMPGYSVYDGRAQFGITRALIAALGG